MWLITGSSLLILLLNFSRGSLAHGDENNTFIHYCNSSRLIFGPFTSNNTGARLWANCADPATKAPVHTVIDLADCLARYRARQTGIADDIEKDVEVVKKCSTKDMKFHSNVNVTHIDVPCGNFKDLKDIQISDILWFKDGHLGCYEVSGRLAEPGENLEVTGNATRRWIGGYSLSGR